MKCIYNDFDKIFAKQQPNMKSRRYNLLYDFITLPNDKITSSAYALLCKDIREEYGEQNFKKIMTISSQIPNHPQECWDVRLDLNDSLQSKCIIHFIERIKNLKLLKSFKEQMKETILIDQFILYWKN